MILERYRDAVTRIREIPLEHTVQSPFREYFCAAAEFVGRLDDFITSFMNEDLLTTDRMPELIRQAAAESCVLLKNDGTLPLDLRDEVAVFGRCQLDWFYVGYGSGGDVHPAYRRSLMDGLRLADARVNEELAGTYRAWTAGKDNAAEQGWWGHWPYSYPEMPLTDAQVQKAAQSAKTALVVIGRAAGEDRENILTQGSYYLTELERDMLDAVTAAFPKTVVLLNTGSVMDLAWTEEYGDKLSALLLLWQGGMESGCAAADVLYGKTSPSGRLADTIARYYVDYPSAANFGGKEFNAYQEGIFVGYRYFEAKAPDCVLFPFGFGLSYTAFDAQPVGFAHREAGVEVTLKITNTGARPGGGAGKAPAGAGRLRQDPGAQAGRE